MSIWEKSVEHNPTAQASWLALLRRLLPALKKSAWLVEWWDRVQEPVLDHLAEDATLASEAWANTLAVLTCDDLEQAEDGEGIEQLVIRLLRIWMQNVQLASQEDNSSVLLKAKLIRGGLLSYGKKRPKASQTLQQSLRTQLTFERVFLLLWIHSLCRRPIGPKL